MTISRDSMEKQLSDLIDAYQRFGKPETLTSIRQLNHYLNLLDAH